MHLLLDCILYLGVLSLLLFLVVSVPAAIARNSAGRTSTLRPFNPLRLFQLLAMRPPQVVLLAEYLASVTRRGRPLPDALRAYANDIYGPLAEAVARAGELVREGWSLADAMDEFPECFDQRLVSFVRAGEASGTLPEMMDQYAALDNRVEKLTFQLFTFVGYPVITSLVLFAILQLVNVRMFRQFTYIFQEMSIQMPPFFTWWATMGWRLVFLCLLALLTYSILQVLRVPSMRDLRGAATPLWDRVMAALAGRTERHCSVWAFCETLAVLLRSGVPTTSAVKLASQAGGVGRTDGAMEQIAEAAGEGGRITETIIRELQLSERDGWALSAADGSDFLPDALSDLGWEHQDRAERSLLGKGEVILPVCVLLQGTLVLVTTIAFFSPLICLINTMSEYAN